MLDRKKVGYIGKIHPVLSKDDIYVLEISVDKLHVKTKAIKFKAASKYPEIKKDLAFIVDKNVSSKTLEDVIKKTGGRLLTEINVFDVYEGIGILPNQKSIAYSLTFQDENRTLTEDEVTLVFEKIIKTVEEKMDAKLRDK